MRAVLLFILGTLVGACAQSTTVPAESPKATYQDLAAKTVALVKEGRSGLHAYCSGVWVGDDTFVTAAHCLHDELAVFYAAKADEPVAAGRPSLPVAIDADHDLALVKALAPLPHHGVARVRLDGIRGGATVETMGHPLGLWWSYSEGVIAAVRKIDLDPDIFYIQTTAATSRGNSGCGLFDEAGNLIGIAHAGMPQGMNLAFYVHGQYVRDLLVQSH